MMCLGVKIEAIDIRSPSEVETANDPFFSKYNLSSAKSITMNKLLLLKKMLVYCSQEEKLMSNLSTSRCGDDYNKVNEKENINKMFMKAARKTGVIIPNFDATLKLMIAYQKTAQVFGPVLIDLAFTSLVIDLNDEQISYLFHLCNSMTSHLNRLQVCMHT